MTDRPIIQADFVKPNPVPSRKVLQLIFEVPEEQADHAMAVLGGYPQSGKNRWCGIARLADKPADTGAAEATETQTASQATQAPKSTEEWSEAKRKMVQRSGIVRREPAFHQFLERNWPAGWSSHLMVTGNPDDAAASFMHQYCGVESCRDLDPDEKSGGSFQGLMDLYRAAMEGRTLDAQEQQARRI